MTDALAGGFARASDLPEDSASLFIGALAGPDGAKGVADLDINLGRDIFLTASGDFANTSDWSASAGFKMKW